MKAAGLAPQLAPCLVLGSVLHQRRARVAHRFTYPIAQLRLPLSQLEQCGNALLGIERARPFSLRNKDHGARDGSPLLPWVRAQLARAGLAQVADGEVLLQTLPRVFGFVFNPVSFWFCHDRAGALRAVLVEVNNTFGETHSYLLFHADLRVIANGDELHADKAFHVSPFFARRGQYRFRFSQRNGIYSAAIDLWDAGEPQLLTRLSGRPQALSAANLALLLLRAPLQGLAVLWRIHWQALLLWRKRLPFHRKPEPASAALTIKEIS